MRRTLGTVAVLALVAGGAVAAAFAASSSSAHSAAAPSRSSAVLHRPTLPVSRLVHCPKRQGTTIAIEACQWKQQVRLDRKFNRRVAALWPLLGNRGRRAFMGAQREWLRHRNHECNFDTMRYTGGSIVPIYTAMCNRRATAGRLKDLALTFSLYHQGQ
jgi:uncharacterized protein YecT (DUF1311 family)